MKQLSAQKINWPLWDAYIVDQEQWCPHIYFSPKELLEHYSYELLTILDTKWIYSSPIQSETQLELDFK